MAQIDKATTNNIITPFRTMVIAGFSDYKRQLKSICCELKCTDDSRKLNRLKEVQSRIVKEIEEMQYILSFWGYSRENIPTKDIILCTTNITPYHSLVIDERERTSKRIEYNKGNLLKSKKSSPEYEESLKSLEISEIELNELNYALTFWEEREDMDQQDITQQEKVFWEAIDIIDKAGLSSYIVITGSWAEHIYKEILPSSYNPVIKTKDLDLLYPNIRRPADKIPLIDIMSEHGFRYIEDSINHVGKFEKSDTLEIEFLTRSIGKGNANEIKIEPIDIISTSLRDVNILSEHILDVPVNGYNLCVPEPAVFVMQKIIINNHREPASKREKDIDSIKNLLPYIEEGYQKELFISIYESLSKKEKIEFKDVVMSNNIDVSKLLEEKHIEEMYKDLKSWISQEICNDPNLIQQVTGNKNTTKDEIERVISNIPIDKLKRIETEINDYKKALVKVTALPGYDDFGK